MLIPKIATYGALLQNSEADMTKYPSPEKWDQVYDGGSDEWLWHANDGACHVFIRINDLPAACGRDATSQWAADVACVEMDRVSPDTLASALQSCGSDGSEFLLATANSAALAQVLFEYGASAPVWSGSAGGIEYDEYGMIPEPDEDGPEFLNLLAEALEEAETVLDGVGARNETLETRVVNRMGQTAREYANGSKGLWDSLRRIAADPDATDEQKLILRMYGKAGQTLGCGPVPADIVAKAAP